MPTRAKQQQSEQNDSNQSKMMAIGAKQWQSE